MSRTRKHDGGFEQALRTAAPYKRQQRRKLLKDFERQYKARNENPLIEL